jgi:hypothetical protein
MGVAANSGSSRTVGAPLKLLMAAKPYITYGG